MALSAGTTLGPYEILSPLGAGGMGEVYRARDTKLDRDVALKVLPEAFTSDPDRLARFEREAKVLASLNHPNIGHIYGLEESEPAPDSGLAGVRALVLELVEGPTLADRISRGPIPLDEALPIARQIAEALEAAHEAGVIHRDLKPANIKVKNDGTVKVLDFGLAKAFQPDADDPNMSKSPTISLTVAATQMGMVIGTAAYMAPEQARGRPVDKRADIWAFGAVLYEMLTASKPFGGEDISEMLAAVIKSEPDWDALPTETPAVLGSFLRGCLKKDPRERVRDIGDVRLAVQGLFETPHDAEAVRVATRPTAVWQRPAPAAVLALSVFALGGLAVWATTRTEPPEPSPVVRFQAPLPPDTLLGVVLNHRLAVSPDGTRVAYAAQDQLYVRRMDEPAFRPLAGTERALEPVFSPDGQSIAFWSDAQLKRVSLLGGAPVPIADMVPYFGASWEADDMILLSIPGVGIARVPATGGDPEVLIPATGDVSQGVLASTFFLRPQILPGGDWILFSLFPSGQVVMQSLVTNEQQLLVERGGDAVYVDTGHLVYADGGVLFARLFDINTHTVGTEPVRLLEGVLQNLNGVAQFDVSDDGTLVSVPGSGAGIANRLVWVDRDGLEEPVATPPGDYSTPRVSPDGSAIAFDRAADIWTLDLARGAETRVTNDLAASVAPLWTPDGLRLVYGTFGTGDDEGLFWKSADGTGDAERLVSIPDAVIVAPSAWSADGNSLVFWGVPNGVNPDIGLFSMNGDDTSVSFLLDSESQEAAPTVSPDGRWIAYDSNESGTPEIYVQRFPELGQRMTVSIDGGTQALWSRDGTEIFYRGPRGMMAVPVSLEPTFSLGAPVALFEDRYAFLLVRRTYDVAPDGRFLMVKESERDNDAAPHIDVVLNWVQELTERLPRP